MSSTQPTADRLAGRLAPTVGGSTYVDPDAIEWKPSQFEGIDIKVLYEDRALGEMTCLLRWAPGTTLPFHSGRIQSPVSTISRATRPSRASPPS